MADIRNMTPEELERARIRNMNQPPLMDQWDMVRQRERGDAEVDPASEAVFDAVTPGGGFFDTVLAKALAGGTGMAILGRLPTKSELKSQNLLKKWEEMVNKANRSEGRLENVVRQKSYQDIPAYKALPEAASIEAGTDALLAGDAETQLLAYLRGKKRLNPRDIQDLPAHHLEKLRGKQRKQVMKTMFNDYRDAGLPAGIDEITGRVVLGDQQNPMWNIYGNKNLTEPTGTQLYRMADDYKWKDRIELAKQQDAERVKYKPMIPDDQLYRPTERMVSLDPEPYVGRNESIRRLTDMSNNIKEKGLGYDPLPNRQGPIQNVFDNGNTNIEPMTNDSNVISFMDYLKRKGK
jgi:hypothetical protein